MTTLTILDQFPELYDAEIEEKYYRVVVTNNTDILNYGVGNIALAFALSQRRSDIRRRRRGGRSLFGRNKKEVST